MGKLAAKPMLRRKLEETLAAAFPGSEFTPERYADRLGGTLVWDGFEPMDQVKRQARLRQALKTGLERDEQLQLSLILTMTRLELAAVTEDEDSERKAKRK